MGSRSAAEASNRTRICPTSGGRGKARSLATMLAAARRRPPAPRPARRAAGLAPFVGAPRNCTASATIWTLEQRSPSRPVHSFCQRMDPSRRSRISPLRVATLTGSNAATARGGSPTSNDPGFYGGGSRCASGRPYRRPAGRPGKPAPGIDADDKVDVRTVTVACSSPRGRGARRGSRRRRLLPFVADLQSLSGGPIRSVLVGSTSRQLAVN
jgi:hypothetical protein